MNLNQMVSSTFKGVTNTVQGVKRFAKLERVLAFVCLFTPAFLIWFDDGPIRENISAYYDMKENQIFYFPLTVVAMLFVVNGFVKQKRFYNIFLGVMLSGVILFNQDDFSALHNIFAVAFFAGNAVVIVVFSSKKELWFKVLLVMEIALSMLAWFLFGWLTLFWGGVAVIRYHLSALHTRIMGHHNLIRTHDESQAEDVE